MSTPPVPQWNLSTRWPVALLPVRVETRFVDVGTSTELWLRILPDVLHVDSHQPELTDDEVAWGRQYWIDTWRAGRVAEDELAAWRRLCLLVEPERAAWIARVLEPAETGRPTAPVPPEKPLPRDPDFPPVPGGADPWSRSPVARGLPSQWQVTLWRAGVAPVYWESTPVRRPLAVAPPAGLDLSGTSGYEPPVDEASRWLVDFDHAVQVGMAGRIPLPPAMAQHGIDRLVVFGVDSDPAAPTDTPAARGSRLLGELLDAHFHTHGLDYVAPGTPTNNTAADRSGRDTRSPQRADLLRVDHGQQPPTEADGDAPVTARALGVPVVAQHGDPLHAARAGAATSSPRALARAAHRPDGPPADPAEAAVSQHAGARHMNTVAWAATWGYFLSDLLTDTIGEDGIRHGRRHFVDHVRAAGPVPTLRIAEQPYGILPVTALNQWSGPDARDTALVSFLRLLRDRVWRPSATELDPGTGLPGVPRVGGPGNAQQVLLRILAQAPVAWHWKARSLLGMEYVTHLWRFLRLRLDGDWRERQAFEPNQLMDLLDLDWAPRVAQAVFAEDAHSVGGPLVDPPAPGTAAGYLRWLADPARSWQELRDRAETDGAATPLLYRVLRQSALAEYATGARRVQSALAPLPADAYRDAELIDIRPDRESWPLWRQLERVLPGGRGAVGDYLRAANPTGEPAVRDLADYRASARALAAYPSADLERLLAEAMDLCAYRLDAWITSFATKKLDAMRTVEPNGVHLGGYGWVENLRRSAVAPTVVTSPPPGERGQLWEGAPNAGYLHAPSLGQATTAAVLRAGYRAHTGPGDNPLAVDLTSDRVRLAAWLLDGVRQGQPLTELLGYRFERQLQDHPRVLEQYLPRLRAIAPVRATRVEHDTRPREVVAATAVVDGLELHRIWRADRIDWGGDPGLPNVGTDDHRALVAVLGSLGEAIDAVADALLAESVHHAAQGNPLRAGATLDAASRGDVPATELEFARTPRTGLALTHRLVLVGGDWPSEPEHWPTSGPTPRADAEPRLEALVRELLPRPASVRCQVEWAGDDGPVTGTVSLDRLGRPALDLLALTDVEDTTADSELAARVLDAATADGLPAGATGTRPVRVVPGRPDGWAAEVLSLDEFVEAARSVRALVTTARPLTAADLSTGEPDQVGPADPAVTGRADEAAALLDQLVDDLTSDDPATLAPALELAAAIGVLGAYTGPDATPAALRARARAVHPEVATRHAALAALSVDATADPDQVRAHDLARLRAVFGADFQVLPTFTVSEPAGLAEALAASTALQHDDPYAAEDWLAEAALVRPGAARLDTVRGYADAVRPGTPPALRVAQLPYADGDRWLALPFTGERPTGSRLGLVVHAPTEVDPTAPLCGLLVDEWVEVLPSDTETTGVAFHAETPGQAAPQAILLAVPADGAPTWTRDALERTLVETLELAPLRAVDVATLGEVGQFLPALYFPVNVDGDTAATDFTRTVPAG
ncbi:hypothetical protein C1I95_22635 [Micromonospora craterilacus]|uniref:Uncharacterized protein n=1 Tax=Micromonospora craterilacus TaxID=1655439 RepID=A0A2W2DUT0_9ACTN|nr:hypothetical protein [Micromonospora craterilacus]PZG13981.1 hypothetical protein C1I95_22635 [Micromonospora craterilacus]